MNGLTSNNLITPKELASEFGVSLASIYRLIEGRKIPFHKIGGLLRFRQSDVDQYLNDVRYEPLKL